MPQPYFPGQTPCECGHYFPDVIRIRDRLAEHDRCGYRLTNCLYCGDWWEKIDRLVYSPDVAVPDWSKLPEIRERERKRLREKK